MLKQLKYFQSVVRLNSFSEAAEENFISQSAISQQVQTLERELGFLLLERKNRSFTLAPAVRTFLHRNDFAGRTVVPFMTNSGWPGHVIKDMKNACPGAEFACEMQMRFNSDGGDRLETPESEIEAWARSVKALL